ncbi:MAG: hypothetical protein ACLTDV_00765 [Eubacterium sp.]
MSEYLPEEVDRQELALVVSKPRVFLWIFPLVLRVKERGRSSDLGMRLNWRIACGKGDVLAITGTNGKTTTTSLSGRHYGTCRSSVFVVGNIGNPLHM